MNVNWNATYNAERNKFIDQGFSILNDDGEYLLVYKVHKQYELVELQKFCPDGVGIISLDFSEVLRLQEGIK